MNENGLPEVDRTMGEVAAFQKIWMESLSKMLQAAFTLSPGAPPTELMRHIRSGLFQALGDSWDEFMRSPQFLEGMRQWMENAVTFRKMTNDFLARARNEMQSPAREDIDSVMISVRHMEKRLLNQIETLSNQLNELNQRLGAAPAPNRAVKRKRSGRRRAPLAAVKEESQ